MSRRKWSGRFIVVRENVKFRTYNLDLVAMLGVSPSANHSTCGTNQKGFSMSSSKIK